jgi:hypothetical protein
MKNILLVHSSPKGSESYSQRVAGSIVKKIKDRHRRTTVTFRDLAQDPLPHLRAVLGFIGLTDIDVVRVEGVAISTIGTEKAAATATAHSLEILARRLNQMNPIDWKVREGHMKDFWPHKLPLILGWDLSGVVEELGSGGSGFKIGDEVYSVPDPTHNGAYADYIVVRESELALKTNSFHQIRAAAVPMAALTAWQ